MHHCFFVWKAMESIGSYNDLHAQYQPFCLTLTCSSHMTYRLFLEHYVSKPFEVRWFEGRKDKQRAFLVEPLILKCSLWICDAHGGLRSHVLLITSNWSAVQPVAANYRVMKYSGFGNPTNTNILDTIIRLWNLDDINEYLFLLWIKMSIVWPRTCSSREQ